MRNLRRGSTGRQVKLLQAALNVQLYPSPNLDVDGIYGRNTYNAVFKYQGWATIHVDGIAGRETFSALELPITELGYTHELRLHFCSLSISDVPFNRLFASAQNAYAPYGIKVRMMSGQSLNLSPADAAKFLSVSGSCEWEITSGEFAELQRLSTNSSPFDVSVFIVSAFDSGLLGCGGHLPGRPACIVAKNCGRWDVAHELGHVLLSSSFTHNNPSDTAHHTSTRNLMHATFQPSFCPGLSPRQVRAIKNSPMCRRIAN